MSETNPPKNFSATSIIGNGSFACTCTPPSSLADWRITHVNGKPVAYDTKPYRGTVADALVYGKAENLSEAIAYHRQKINESFDNPWHTEVRETYTLEPKWAVWKQIAIWALWFFASSTVIDLAAHKPQAYAANLALSAGLAPLVWFVTRKE